MGFIQKYGFLVFLIFLAVVLRFWGFADLPYTYDELSTLFRVNQGSASEIQRLILADNHPPGHHMLFKTMGELTNYDASWVKLPFLVSGVLSVLLFYRIAQTQLNESAARLSSLFFVLCQFQVMNSQIARPYAIGQFLILFLLWLIVQQAYKRGLKRQVSTVVLMGITLAGCAYLHYLAALTAGIVWASAWLFDKNVRSWRFFYLVPAIALLMTWPLFDFLIEQWSHKGLASIMSVHGPDFIAQHLFRLANFSWIHLVVSLACIFVGVLLSKQKGLPTKLQWHLLFMGTFPWAIIWLYSAFRAPLLSDRALYFTMPFVLLFAFSGIRLESKKVRTILGVLLFSSGLFSLVLERQHYEIFYAQGFEEVAQNISANNNTSSLNILNSNPDTYAYIESLYPKLSGVEYLNPDSSAFDFVSLRQSLEFHHYNQVQWGETMEFYRTPLEIVPLIREYCPEVTIDENYFNSHYMCFNDRRNTKHVERTQGLHQYLVEQDSLRYQDAKNMEWVGEFKVNLNTCIQDDSDYIFSAVDIQYDEIPNAELVLEILEDEEVVYRKTSPFNRFLVAGRNQGPVYVAIDGSDCTFDASNMVVKAYVWNLDKSAFGVRSISLWSEKGNPIKYALEQDF